MRALQTITLRLLFAIAVLANYVHAQTPEAEPSDTPQKIQPQIFGMKKNLDSSQIKRITDAQASFLKRHQCVVSYGFYNDIYSELSVRQAWKDFANKDKERNFHLFLKIGAFHEGHTVAAYYRFPPPLEDVKEVDKVLLNLVSDIQSETSLDDVIDRSIVSVEDELSYLKNKPKYEAKEQKKASDFAASKLKAYFIKLAKLITLIVVPLLAIALLWAILTKILNRRPYRFPDVNYTPRLGAKHTAKSISQIRK